MRKSNYTLKIIIECFWIFQCEFFCFSTFALRLYECLFVCVTKFTFGTSIKFHNTISVETSICHKLIPAESRSLTHLSIYVFAHWLQPNIHCMVNNRIKHVRMFMFSLFAAHTYLLNTHARTQKKKHLKQYLKVVIEAFITFQWT